MESSDPIFLFLKKMRLDKHYSKFVSNPHFRIKSLEECKCLLSNPNYLEDIGLSSAEVNRFKRLFEKALKESVEECQKEIPCTPVGVKSEPSSSPDQHIDSATKVKTEVNHVRQNVESIEKGYFLLYFKYLNEIDTAVVHEKNIASSEWMSLRYFQLVSYFFEHFTERHPTLNCSSVEIYHRNGSPMVTNPSDYFKLVREFCEDDFKFIFIIPKKLYIIDRITFLYSNCCFQYIPIVHFGTRSSYRVKLLTNRNLRIEDLKYRCSLQFHLPHSTLSFNLQVPDGKMEHNLRDNIEVSVENLLNQDYTLYLSVSEHYWEPDYLNAFKFDNYFPLTRIPIVSLIYLNVYLLSLVQRTISKKSFDTFTKCLGLLREISCFPPLIYSLWSLYRRETITLPHKIAVIEGLINTVRILYGTLNIDKLFDFSCLWAYLEQNCGLSHFEDETYKYKANVNWKLVSAP